MYRRAAPWYTRPWVKLIGGGLLLLAVFVFLSPSLLGNRATPIREIVAHPEAFADRTVTIRGIVVSIVSPPILDVTFIKVRDDTGEIWCRFSGRLKNVHKNDKICVRGYVYKLLEIPIPGTTLKLVGISKAQLCPMERYVPKLP